MTPEDIKTIVGRMLDEQKTREQIIEKAKI
jgi:hypothetical protein